MSSASNRSALALSLLLGCETTGPVEQTPPEEMSSVDTTITDSIALLKRASENPCAPGLRIMGEGHHFYIDDQNKCSMGGQMTGFSYNGDCHVTSGNGDINCLDLMPTRRCPGEDFSSQKIIPLGGFEPEHQAVVEAMLSLMDDLDSKTPDKKIGSPIECPERARQ